ncbi:hypothetical protein EVAR_27826_1 [Eumeta japonica]|uniref:Uncharacterized protein n=1 Tax=Eumeta variegata TaxID=151549 RepID=A0A4C1VJ74_EUMVA|nr:hypothetical protein EVAR_27826_1 [Eumeta japonica]
MYLRSYSNSKHDLLHSKGVVLIFKYVCVCYVPVVCPGERAHGLRGSAAAPRAMMAAMEKSVARVLLSSGEPASILPSAGRQRASPATSMGGPPSTAVVAAFRPAADRAGHPPICTVVPSSTARRRRAATPHQLHGGRLCVRDLNISAKVLEGRFEIPTSRSFSKNANRSPALQHPVYKKYCHRTSTAR